MNKEDHSKRLIEKLVKSILYYNGDKILSSIILTGSFGRKEPTYIENEDKSVVLKSDVEVALIYPVGSSRKALLKLVENVSKDFEEDLNLMPMTERRMKKVLNFNYDINTPAKKTLFTFDLYNGSYTIWGRDYLKINSVLLEDVDPYEAKRIVSNRIGELVYNCCVNDDDYLRMQWKAKVMLAIVSGWLLLNKLYKSSFHEQFRMAMEYKNDLSLLLGSTFLFDYQQCFYMLRENGEVFEVADDKLRNYVRNIDAYFKKYGLLSPKVNGIARRIKYLLKYIKTDRKFGVTGFENNILQSLLDKFICEDVDLDYTARIWHETIY